MVFSGKWRTSELLRLQLRYKGAGEKSSNLVLH